MNDFICGDCLKVLSDIPEGSVTMSVQRLDELWGTVTVNPYIPS